MAETNRPIELGHRLPDTVAASARAAAGMIPVVGSALAELVAPFIKGQRLDRVESFMVHLDQRLSEFAASVDTSRAEAIEIIEQGLREALDQARQNRVKQIAHSVAHGIKTDPADQVNREVVSIVAQLEPDDIHLLRAIARRIPLPANKRENVAVQASWSRLERFSLIEFQYRTNKVPLFEEGYAEKKIEVPAVDTWGRRKGHHTVTDMGLKVLESLGFAEPPKAPNYQMFFVR